MPALSGYTTRISQHFNVTTEIVGAKLKDKLDEIRARFKCFLDYDLYLYKFGCIVIYFKLIIW
jgi:hypothetical protein